MIIINNVIINVSLHEHFTNQYSAIRVLISINEVGH